MVNQAQSLQPREVRIGQVIGIILLPIVFSWTLLRKGHSVLSRIIGFVWLFVSVIIFFAIAGYSAEHAPLTGAGLSKAYLINQIDANNKYTNKSVQVNCVVGRISKGFNGTIVPEMQSGSRVDGFKAWFANANQTEADALKPGQRVIIQGVVHFNNTMWLEECRLVPQSH